MTRPVLAALGMLGLVASCTPARSATTLRVAYPSTVDLDDVPSLLAHERLEARGHRVIATFYAQPELAAEALARGDADIASGSVRTFWAAAARGADIRTVMEHAGNVYRLVADGTVRTCEALDGRALAVHSEAATSTAQARAYVDRHCPGAHPRLAFLPGSETREVALLSHAVPAAVIDLAGVVRLERHRAGEFFVLGDFSREWPDMPTDGVYVNRRYTAAYPDAVRDYLRARLDAHRDVAGDPGLLVRVARRWLGDAPDLAELARAYVATRTWPEDGGLTNENVGRTLAFFVDRGDLDPSLTVERVADLSFLDALRTAADRF